jgi:cytochrome o ubiquinol oxidase operon protein cyoD
MKSYVSGFAVSLLLTLTAFALVAQHIDTSQDALSHNVLIPVVIGLAIVQLMVQLVFFLHLGRESKPRFNLTAFLFMLLVVVLLVGGSLWIMH